MCECCGPSEKEKKEWEEYAKKREEEQTLSFKENIEELKENQK